MSYDYRPPETLRKQELASRIQELQTYVSIMTEELSHRPETDEPMHGFRFGGRTFMYRTFGQATEAYIQMHKAAAVEIDIEGAPYRIQTFYRRTDDVVSDR